MKNAFILNPAISNETATHALHEKTTQAKALLECILSAILSSEVERRLLYDAVWAIDDYLDQMATLQDHIESATT